MQDRNKDRFGGLVPAMLTPCRKPGKVDPEGYEKLCGIMVDKGCNGLFVVGSTGEMPLLDEEDRKVLIQAARRAVGDDVPLYAGVSGLGQRQTIRYAEMAADAGADVAVVMVPFSLKFNQQELRAYVTGIAEASPLPLGLYHHLRMPTVFEVDTVVRLAEHPNVAVMKDTSSDMERLIALQQGLEGSGMVLLQGREPFVLPSMQAGADGCINALANIAPEWFRLLFDAHAAGHDQEAERWQERITDLADIFRLEPCGRSFASWAYTLRWTAVQRGFIDSTADMMPGFEPEPGFDDQIRGILDRTGLLDAQ